MKKFKSNISKYFPMIILSLMFLSGAPKFYRTDFKMTLFLTNHSDKVKKVYLEKGRVFEINAKGQSHFQSIILTQGYGVIEIQPGELVKKEVAGVCLNKGLKYPEYDTKLQITPFVGDADIIEAGNDQGRVHNITNYPKENVMVVTAKGYSDNINNGRADDREEAFKNAVENAAKETGVTFSSKTILNNFKLIEASQQMTIDEKSVKLNKIVHEEYNADNGEYLFIGEFEIKTKPSRSLYDIKKE